MEQTNGNEMAVKKAYTTLTILKQIYRLNERYIYAIEQACGMVTTFDNHIENMELEIKALNSGISKSIASVDEATCKLAKALKEV